MRLGFTRGSGRRGALAIASGTAGGQLAAFAAAPILSRVYEPHDFGAYSVVTATALIVSSVIALGLERAIAVPKDDKEAKDLALTGMTIVALLSACLLGATIAGRTTIGRWLNLSDIDTWLWTIPSISAVAGVYALASQLAIRSHRFRAIAVRNVAQPAVMTAAQAVLSFAPQLPGLVLGNILGRLVGIVGLLNGAGLRSHFRWNHSHARRTTRLLRSYWRFPALGAPAALLNAVALQVAPILVAAHFTRDVTGQFGMAFTIVALPVSLLGGAVAQVFLGNFARLRHDDPSRALRLFGRTSRSLALVGAMVGITLAVLGPIAFRIILGNQWELAGELARAMAIMIGFRLLSAPVSVVLAVLERQGLQLMLDTLRLMGTIIIFSFLPASGLSISVIVFIYAAFQALVYVISWCTSWRCVLAITSASTGGSRVR